jgi:hypothetical protein
MTDGRATAITFAMSTSKNAALAQPANDDDKNEGERNERNEDKDQLVDNMADGRTTAIHTTSALWECGSGAPRRRVLRGPCLLSKPPGKKKKAAQRRVLGGKIGSRAY